MPEKKTILPQREHGRLRVTVDLDKETARRLQELLQREEGGIYRQSISATIRRAISEMWDRDCAPKK